MESEILEYPSYLFKNVQSQIEQIHKASESAQSILDYKMAHDEDILYAISIVEDFLRKKNRLCYGGQAINAHLPKKYKIYDPKYSIPDYDFFSPNVNQDILLLTNYFKKAGYDEIYVREGMHHGTMKIYINFIPVADITSIDYSLYSILYKRRYISKGISYLDANTLRMLMYLELSHPRGEVSRWPKVYERLVLFNQYIPHKRCKSTYITHHLTSEYIQYIINYIINHKYIFAGLDIVDFYKTAIYKKRKILPWNVHHKSPIIFYSPNPSIDISTIKNHLDYLGASSLHSKTYNIPYSDIIPSMTVLFYKKQPCVYIIESTACNSYFNIPIKHQNTYSEPFIKIASIDTLITLYFSIGLHTTITIPSIECVANQLVHISIYSRKSSTQSILPFISIKCSGHQSSMPSLIKSKIERLRFKTRKQYSKRRYSRKNSYRGGCGCSKQFQKGGCGCSRN